MSFKFLKHSQLLGLRELVKGQLGSEVCSRLTWSGHGETAYFSNFISWWWEWFAKPSAQNCFQEVLLECHALDWLEGWPQMRNLWLREISGLSGKNWVPCVCCICWLAKETQGDMQENEGAKFLPFHPQPLIYRRLLLSCCQNNPPLIIYYCAEVVLLWLLLLSTLASLAINMFSREIWLWRDVGWWRCRLLPVSA